MKFRDLLPLLLPLAAFADDARLPYACDNGSRIDITFLAEADGRPAAHLHFADEVVALPQVPAAAGALYRRGEIRLHTEGDEAILEDGKGNRRRCTRGMAPPAGASPTAPAATGSFVDLSGRVSYHARIALPPDAVLILRIQDTGRPGAPPLTLAEQRYELNGAQVPIAFSATVDRDLIGKQSRLTAVARIEAGGKLRWRGDQRYPALQNGQPEPVDIVLKPVSRRPR